jgi:molybdenum cofactor cytidylyltransferase
VTRVDVAAVILAAGQGTRMGAHVNKLLEPLEGRALVRHVAEAALASRASAVYAVLGHQAERVQSAFAGLPLRVIENAEHAEGLASSIRAAVRVAGHHAGLLFCLGDMPRVDAATLDRLMAAFGAQPSALALRPQQNGKAGNPVLWSARAYPELLDLVGAEGARPLLQRHAAQVHRVEVSCAGIHLDVDTPQHLQALRG